MNDQQIHQDNPAGRLRYWLFDRFKGWPRPGDSILAASCGLLGFEPNTIRGRTETLRLGTMLADLVDEVRYEAQRLPSHFAPNMLITDLDQVAAAIDQFSSAPKLQVSNMLGRIDPAGERCLAQLDMYLHMNRPQRLVTESEGEDLLTKISDIVEQIRADESLSDEVRDFVLKHLYKVEQALAEPWLHGPGALERAVDALVGALCRRRDVLVAVAEQPWFKVLNGVVVMLVMTLGVVGDFAGLQELLPGGSSGHAPSVEPTVNVDTDVDLNVEINENGVEVSEGSEGEDEVHEAEIVEDDDDDAAGQPAPVR